MMDIETNDISDELFEFPFAKISRRIRRVNERRCVSLSRKGGSYIDSPKWLKNKKATINPKK